MDVLQSAPHGVQGLLVHSVREGFSVITLAPSVSGEMTLMWFEGQCFFFISFSFCSWEAW